jgi:hypothetical protein
MTREAFIDIYRELDRIQDQVAASSRMAQLTSMRSNIGRGHTIAADTISPGANEFIILTPQSGNVDDLSTINDGRAQRQIALRTGDPAYTITVKDGVGNIDLCGADITLDCVEKVLILVYDADLTAWIRFGLDADATVENFLNLSDTPGSYVGQSLKHLRVNVGETAVEFVDHVTPPVINFGTQELLTISGGAVTRTATTSFFRIAAESGIADNLSTINGGSEGDVVIIKSDTGDTITVNEAGNIRCVGTTRTLDNPADKMTLLYDGAISLWCEISQAGNL